MLKSKNYSIITKRLFLFMFVLLLNSIVSASKITPGNNDTTLVLTGKYTGKNIQLINPMSGSAKCSFHKIFVNGKTMPGPETYSTAFEVNLKDCNLSIGDTIKIEITYEKGQAPRIINPSALTGYSLLNSKLPLFIGKDINEKDINIDKMTGNVLVINTWFVGCKPCAAEIPALNNLVKKYENKNVAFLAPSLSNTDMIKEFLLSHPFNYDIIPNSKEYCENMLKCESYPNNIVANKKGEIIYFSNGLEEKIEATLEDIIDKALKE